ncbi:MAG: hypothetical protein JW871_02285 [Endomicrobiales bacterium]|nr:hypothetical protein [Endomicrobiales bacterium]
MRLSDILKKSSKKTAPEKEQKKAKEITPEVKSETSVFKKTPVDRKPEKPKVVRKEASVTIPEAEECYAMAIQEIKNITISRNKDLLKDIQCVPKLINLIENKNEALLILAAKATPDIYLYGHSVNTCVLSILTGHDLGFSKSKLLNLGLFSFLYNSEMLDRLGITLRNGKLSQDDLNKINNHLPLDREILNNIPKLAEGIKNVISNLVVGLGKYKDNSNYPVILVDNDDIEMFSQIISISSIYETLVHPSDYNDKLIPHDAIKTIINYANDYFDSSVMKAFVDSISIYPPGSYIRLNTNETARVVGINKGLPTRPKVHIIIDSDKNKVTKLRIIDLSMSPMFYIKEAVDETKIELLDKRLALELKAMRWWVKGI